MPDKKNPLSTFPPKLKIDRTKQAKTFFGPSSPSLTAVTRTISAGVNLDTLKQSGQKGTEITISQTEVEEDGKIKTISSVLFKTDKSKTLVTQELLFPRGLKTQTLKKLLLFVLTKVSEQCVDAEGKLIIVTDEDGTHSKDAIFATQELVDSGLYANWGAAKRGLVMNLNRLIKISVAGYLNKGGGIRLSLDLFDDTGKDDKTNDLLFAVNLFTGFSKENEIKIFLNPRINWNSLLAFRALYPWWIYKLSDNGFSLILYICSVIRMQSDKAIKDKIVISFDSIRSALVLPDPDHTNRPTQTIKNPILKAIEDVIAQAQEENDNDLQIKMVTASGKIKTWLEQSYLEISVTGAYLDSSYEILDHQLKATRQISRKPPSRKD